MQPAAEHSGCTWRRPPTPASRSPTSTPSTPPRRCAPSSPRQRTSTDPVRVVRKHRGTEVWANINSRTLPDNIRDTWYHAVHDLVCTRARLHATNQDDGPASQCGRCTNCDPPAPDTLLHRLTECGDAEGIWAWLQRRRRRAALLGVPVQPEVNLRPDFLVPYKVLQAAAVWVIVAYLLGAKHPVAAEFKREITEAKNTVLANPSQWSSNSHGPNLT